MLGVASRSLACRAVWRSGAAPAVTGASVAASSLRHRQPQQQQQQQHLYTRCAVGPSAALPFSKAFQALAAARQIASHKCSPGGSAAHFSSNPQRSAAEDPLELPPNLKLSLKCKQLIRDARRKQLPPAEPSFTVPVIDLVTGEEVDTVALDPFIFGHEIRRDVVHAVVRWQLACRRQGAAKTKLISEVSGSGKKMRPQKGSGQARCGHKRPPHWRGGAKAHGPKGNRDWSYKLHKKVRKMGLRVALSAKLRERKLVVVDALTTDGAAATGPTAERLRALGLLRSALLVDGAAPEDALAHATRHLPGVKLLWGGAANCYDILRSDRLVVSRAGLQFLTEKLAA
ncbi:ribosomal protein L4 domain-containing protein [Tribonema minus]|uniref:Large ribosomal subunit protein uL4m n=1 Tax=Tribonema minus TaxID=303371 RepID=A0A835ZAZ5_9STRA|nr:ribosomal protein L4 domain-containing protein [Tribonema minus]